MLPASLASQWNHLSKVLDVKVAKRPAPARFHPPAPWPAPDTTLGPSFRILFPLRLPGTLTREASLPRTPISLVFHLSFGAHLDQTPLPLGVSVGLPRMVLGTRL